MFGDILVIALTVTATKKIQEEICKALLMENRAIVSYLLDRYSFVIHIIYIYKKKS